MNLTILVVDYETYEFEGGYYSTHPPCPTCVPDLLPFDVISTPAADYGDVAFVYSVTGDSLFWGTIIWMGCGEILYPDTIIPTSEFPESIDVIAPPTNIEYYSLDFEITAAADSAWRQVQNLDIVRMYSQKSYQVGILFYTPTVGAFDPGPAKWIIFLYQDLTRVGAGADGHQALPQRYTLHRNYPNPFNPVTTIRYELPVQTNIRLVIYDLQGREVVVLVEGVQGPGIREVLWDAATAASGIYFYQLQTEAQVITKKLVLLK
ncbi:MAG: T9SS type A sorting domain-containing protein [Candidatus Neomarinimicrobiota bacterium]